MKQQLKMKNRMKVFCGVVAMVACMPAVRAESVPDHPPEPDARAILQKMARYLAQAPGFSVIIDSKYDAIQADGQRIEFAEKRQVQLQRPSQLRVDVTRSDGDKGMVLFDGKTITTFKEEENIYAQVPLAGTVDNAVVYLVKELQVAVPLARMLLSTLPQELESQVQSASYVEANTLTDVPTEHIAARLANVDVQLWIAVGDQPVPRRVVITYKNEPGQPQFRADLSGWKMAPSSSADAFVWTAPKGAELVPLLAPVHPELPAVPAEGVTP